MYWKSVECECNFEMTALVNVLNLIINTIVLFYGC